MADYCRVDRWYWQFSATKIPLIFLTPCCWDEFNTHISFAMNMASLILILERLPDSLVGIMLWLNITDRYYHLFPAAHVMVLWPEVWTSINFPDDTWPYNGFCLHIMCTVSIRFIIFSRPCHKNTLLELGHKYIWDRVEICLRAMNKISSTASANGSAEELKIYRNTYAHPYYMKPDCVITYVTLITIQGTWENLESLQNISL